ncbi:ABC transporter ATP-binding protein [bacterium]|nr:ABC transporter ATP-binding protein [candidate division CSSED10-310 bacterium]
MPALLNIHDLRTYFSSEQGVVKAVDGLSLTVAKGACVGLVGESGCGKSVTALSVLRLISDPPGRIIGGSIYFDGCDLLALKLEEMRRIRGDRIAMVFQEPLSSLNPVFTIGEQIGEVLRWHRGMSRRAARAAAADLLEMVRMPAPKARLRAYPHELSGGMRQRAMIAMALACEPALLIADEPTTALDVTIQAQILELLNEFRANRGLSLLMITHDLGVVNETADEVVVMYAGRAVEHGSVDAVLRRPLHPYTRGLIHSLPGGDGAADDRRRSGRLPVIPGVVPVLAELPPGCAFAPRCSMVMDDCRRAAIPMFMPEAGHQVRCLLHAGRNPS